MSNRTDTATRNPDGQPIDLRFAEFLKEVVACFDPQLRHTYVNPAIERFTGRRASDFIGKTNGELGMPDEQVAQWDKALDAAFRTGQSSEIRFSFGTPEGERLFRSQILPQLNTQGAVTSVMTIAFELEANQLAGLAGEHFKAIIESSDDAIIGKTLDGTVTSWNRGAETIFGYSSGEMIGNSLFVLFPIDRMDEEKLIVERLMLGEKVDHFETVRVHKDGKPVHVSVTISPIRDRDGTVIGASKLARDITPHKAEQERLQLLLAEKDALLKEVHHRVKNNLQVVTSMLRLEAGRSNVADTKSVLGEMQARIRAMAVLHETLYNSGTFASVDLGAYLRQLSMQAFKTQSTSPHALQLALKLGSVRVSMDQAIPCGLLVNELISNCLKHGFPNGITGSVSIELQPLGTPQLWCLRVSDTGVGLPENFEEKCNKSLGLQLVTNLARQLGGDLVIQPNPEKGVAFSVNFQVVKPAPADIPT